MSIPRLLLMSLILSSFVKAASASSSDGTACPAAPDVSKKSLQLVVVTAADDKTSTAVLRRFERSKVSEPWHSVGNPIGAVVGKNGLGWGMEFAKWAADVSDPQKKEGDGKTPAGIFAIGKTFGFAGRADASQKGNYKQLNDSTYCIDDQSSTSYNHIVDTADPRLTSNPQHNEKMRAQPLYEMGAEIDYHSSRKLGTGSCIFMHIWKDAGHGTAGCVAMEKDNVRDLIHWMNPRSKPAMAVMTARDYQRLHECLGLP